MLRPQTWVSMNHLETVLGQGTVPRHEVKIGFVTT